MKLKPCPFCGETKILIIEGFTKGSYRTICDNCCCVGASGVTKEKAADVWNTRTTQYEDIGMENPFKDPAQSPSTRD